MYSLSSIDNSITALISSCIISKLDGPNFPSICETSQRDSDVQQDGKSCLAKIKSLPMEGNTLLLINLSFKGLGGGGGVASPASFVKLIQR